MTCNHVWGNIQFIPIAYQDKKIDKITGNCIPARAGVRWKRKCTICGIEQKTKKIDQGIPCFNETK